MPRLVQPAVVLRSRWPFFRLSQWLLGRSAALRRWALVFFLSGTLSAADWPMWRFDAQRSAASPENLPSELTLHWTWNGSPREQVWDDPLNHDLMPYDKIFEPVVMNGTVFLSFNDSDKLAALDLKTGRELWTFYADGPVRFPAAAWRGKVYFASDDGCLYCVSASDGRLLWRFRGGPSERKVLGNGRVISAWPARGGPVVRDGRVYFAASIWPFMGVFIYALDAEDGRVLWVNDGSGSQFIKQPHSAPSFAGVAPQGALVATEEILLVPGGRSVPAAFDRTTGEFRYFHLNEGGKGNGGSFVAANDTQFFVHTRLRGVQAYDLRTGTAEGITLNEPVLEGMHSYTAATNRKGPVIQELGPDLKVRWEVPVDASGDLIKAGDRLYAAGATGLTAVDVPKAGKPPRVGWSQRIAGEVLRLVAADGHLLAVTLDGRILAYGGGVAAPVTHDVEREVLHASPEDLARARALLNQVGEDEGYVLWFGLDDPALVEALLLKSKLQIVAVDRDPAVVDELRRKWDAAGLYGSRVTAHVSDPLAFNAPPYIASWVNVGRSFVDGLDDDEVLRSLFQSVRPYGGRMRLDIPHEEQVGRLSRLIEEAGLEQAKQEISSSQILVVREGPLPGAADWTHQYGDIANTVKSDDARVKAPLGILWFGGPSNMDVLPRHGHGPPEQVVAGRLFIQGMNSISARDVYTGRRLWKREFGTLGTFGIYYNETYTNTPLSTAYNQKHIPGANGRGANYIATEDKVYVVVDDSCHVLEAKSGKRVKKISLNATDPGEGGKEWGYIGVYEDILLAGDGFAHYSRKLSGRGARTAATIEDYSASDGLVAFDRHSGRLMWRVQARHSFLHNGIVAGNGRIYCLDKLPQSAEDKLKRRGAALPLDYRIASFDARTGSVLWESSRDIFGTWLGYSDEHDILLLAGAKASDRLADEVGQGMTAYQGADGTVLWQDLSRTYTGPCILHNDLILTSANSYQASSGAFSLLDGSPHLLRNPLTGRLEPWRITRAYGCNNVVASENLLTFRSGAAGFYDLITKSGTGNLGGFKSGCTANLVVANGVLNAPDYTRTCSCAYQNQTSLALVHMPDIEMWTFSQFGLDAEEGERIQRVGINFGAPGDRRSDDGTLWLEFPAAGNYSPGLEVKVQGEEAGYFRRHASQVEGPGLTWVAASGVQNCESITISPRIQRASIAKPGKAEAADEAKPPDSSGPSFSDTSAGAAPYTVRLYFAEPYDVAPGERVFNVSLQGQIALEDFDIAKTSEGRLRTVVREFNNVKIGERLTVKLTRASDAQASPILSGIELIAENADL